MHESITMSSAFIISMISISHLFIIWFIDYKNFISVTQTRILTLGVFLEIVISFYSHSLISFLLLISVYSLHYYFYLNYLKNWLLASFLVVFSFLLITSSWFITFDLPRLLINLQLYDNFLGMLIFHILQQLFILLEIFVIKYFNKKYKLLDSLLLLKKNYKGVAISFLFLFTVLTIFQQKKMYPQHTETYILSFLTIGFLCFGLWLFIWLSKEIQQTESLLSEKQQYLYTQLNNAILADEFRHDYKNILSILHFLMKQKDYLAAEEYLESLIEYSHTLFSSNHYPMIQNIQIASLRNLLYNFLKRCEDAAYPITIYIPETIETLQINVIDYIRILSLVMDNALEASEEEAAPALELSLQRKNGYIEFILKNHISKKIPLQNIIKKKYTTKANHTGYGLHILDKTLNSYKHAQYNLAVRNSFFEVIIQIREYPL